MGRREGWTPSSATRRNAKLRPPLSLSALPSHPQPPHNHLSPRPLPMPHAQPEPSLRPALPHQRSSGLLSRPPSPSPRLSLSNSVFFKNHPELDLNHHAENAQDSHSIHFVPHSRHSSSSQNSPGPASATVPLVTKQSPAEEYACLYPPPPHLTPVCSPSTTPRCTSPSEDPPTGEWAAGADEEGMHPIGKLTIRVLEARGLKIDTGREKPYVLLQYDRTE